LLNSFKQNNRQTGEENMQQQKKILLFICTGNVCRSPMAEYLLRHYLGNNSGWKVESAALSGITGIPASGNAVKALAEKDIDLTPHRSKRITAESVYNADCVIAMTSLHKKNFCLRFPYAADKIYLLKTFIPKINEQDIDDPIGMPLATYRKTRDEIDEAIQYLLKHLHNMQND
jgi:protein-tyrosine-phosphatase